MKGLLHLLLVISPLFLIGCASPQLTIEQHGKHYAPALGIDQSDILFLSYANFSFVKEPELEKRVGTNGVLALTDSKLCLLAPHPKLHFSKDLF